MSCLQPHYQDLYEIWVDHVVLLVIEESSLPLKHSSIPVKMCSDSQGFSSIPSDLLVYVLRIVNVKIMSKNDNSRELQAFQKSSKKSDV